MINLDYASYTPVDDAVLEEFCRFERVADASSFSTHDRGLITLEVFNRAKKGFADFLRVSPDDVMFNSGTTEGNNYVIKGIAKMYGHKGRHILTTPFEHPSVSGVLSYLKEDGFEIEILKVDTHGQIDLSHLKSALRSDTILLCVAKVESELGIIQDTDAIGDILDDFPSCFFHVDAAQAMCKVSVNMHKNMTSFCFSPRKFYGLSGFGILVKRSNVAIEPLIHGGGDINRGGTPSIGMIHAALKAMELSYMDLSSRLKHVYNAFFYIYGELKDVVHINTPLENTSRHIINMSVKGMRGVDMQNELNKRGIAVSVKSACSTDNTPSKAVYALTKNKQLAMSSFRVSLSHLTTRAEVDVFIRAVKEIVNERGNK